MMTRRGLSSRLGLLISSLLMGAASAIGCVAAPAEPAGRVTGFALPRFVSVKTHPANVRGGPGTDYRIAWTFTRRGLPVEITAEFGQWRRIRDWQGKEGWMLGALLSGRRTALIAPWSGPGMVPMRNDESRDARIVAYLQRKVQVRILSCDGRWCEVRVNSREGYVRQTRMWGVYPGERI